MLTIRLTLGSWHRRLGLWLIWHIPARVVYWSLIRAWAHATTGPWSSEEATGVAMDTVVTRWDAARAQPPTKPCDSGAPL